MFFRHSSRLTSAAQRLAIKETENKLFYESKSNDPNHKYYFNLLFKMEDAYFAQKKPKIKNDIALLIANDRQNELEEFLFAINQQELDNLFDVLQRANEDLAAIPGINTIVSKLCADVLYAPFDSQFCVLAQLTLHCYYLITLLNDKLKSMITQNWDGCIALSGTIQRLVNATKLPMQKFNFHPEHLEKVYKDGAINHKELQSIIEARIPSPPAKREFKR